MLPVQNDSMLDYDPRGQEYHFFTRWEYFLMAVLYNRKHAMNSDI